MRRSGSLVSVNPLPVTFSRLSWRPNLFSLRPLRTEGFPPSPFNPCAQPFVYRQRSPFNWGCFLLGQARVALETFYPVSATGRARCRPFNWPAPVNYLRATRSEGGPSGNLTKYTHSGAHSSSDLPGPSAFLNRQDQSSVDIPLLTPNEDSSLFLHRLLRQ